MRNLREILASPKRGISCVAVSPQSWEFEMRAYLAKLLFAAVLSLAARPRESYRE